MKTSITLLAGLTTTALATSTQLVKNYCSVTLYLTIYNNGTTDGPFQLPSQEAYINPIIGEGNTATLSHSADIYSSSVAKLILGTSTNQGVLYWSANDEDGNPFPVKGWDVTSSGTSDNVCGNATTYGSHVYACADNDVTLTLSAC